ALKTRVRFDFTTVKLLDFESRLDELEASDNPFALFVLAYLRAKRNRDGERRLRYKIELARLLYHGGRSREDVVHLLRLLDKVIGLPHALKKPFNQAIRQIEEDHTMGVRGNIEEWAMEDQARKAILTVIEKRFGTLPTDLGPALERVESLEILDDLIGQAVLVEDVDAYLQTVRERATG
ncbi:MAG: hypothetical protein V2A76_14695, partial [Planctomycetota bacterium]